MIEHQNPTYLVSFTAGGLLHEETISLSSYYNNDKIEFISEQIINNSLMKTNSQASRQSIWKYLGNIYDYFTECDRISLK